jgi:small subunit ribosomal protein S1
MSKKDIFGDEISKNNDNDFASMFENHSSGVGQKLSVGQKFHGEILSINKEESFISTPSTQDAMILNADLLDADKNLKYKVGDRIEVVVVNTKAGEIRVSRVGSKKSSADMDSLEDAFDMEMPVEGRVTEVCNGGFRVQIQNKTAFCPVSQMDYKTAADHSIYVDKKFEFLITQFDARARNIVVSRRKLLDSQKLENEGDFMNKFKAGDIVGATVNRFEKFGAFMGLGGGVEGLCHISEIGWSRLADPSEVLSLGQSVQVKILSIAEADGRLKISLSVKAAGGEGDPWMQVPQNFPLGSQHDGVIEKKEQYGYFVNIAPGITGLLPRSKWRDHLEAASFENKKKGDKIKIQIDEILFEQKRISLGIAGSGEDQTWRDVQVAKSGFSTNRFGGLSDLLKKK